MKKIYFSLFFSVFLSFVFDTSFSQTITLGSLGTTSFCPSGTLAVPFTTDLPAGTVFKVYLSSSSGSFTPQTQIGSGTTSPINITFPNLGSGTGFLIKIVSVSPSYTSNFSNSLSSNGKYFSLIVNNVFGREINYSSKICQGSSLTGVISANQTDVSYEWKKNGVIQNADPSLKMTQNGTYIASAQKAGCGTTTRNLNINFTSSTIYVDLDRVGSEYQCSGGQILFKSGYFSDSATYQWKKDGTNILNAVKDTLVTSQSGVYNVNSNDKCSIQSNSSTAEKNNQRVLFGNTIENQIRTFFDRGNNKLCGTLQIGLHSGGAVFLENNPLNNYSYQWKKDGVDIIYATSNFLGDIQNQGVYSLKISQGNCSSISNAISLAKVDTLKLSYDFEALYTNEICQGMQTIIQETTILGISQRNLYKNGVLYRQSVSGPITLNEDGNYVITGSQQGCVVLPSDTIKIRVGNSLKAKLYVNDKTLCNGQTTQINLYQNSVSGLASPQFQWYRNNQIQQGYNNLNLIYVNQPGFYKVKILSGNCVGFSDSVDIKFVSVLPKLKIYDENGNILNQLIEKCINNLQRVYAKNISLYENEFSNDSIFLRRGSQIITRKLSAYYPFYLEQTGVYTLIRKQGICLSEESDPVEIKIGEPITANITGSTSIYTGQKVNLNLNFTGGNAWTYQTSDVATGQTTSLSPTIKNVSPTTTQTYSITSVASNCGVGTITGNATVTVLPCPIGQTVSLQSGNWNTSTTWSCGQIPTSAYDAIIENGHTVTLPNAYQGVTKRLDLRGGLTQGVGSGIRIN